MNYNPHAIPSTSKDSSNIKKGDMKELNAWLDFYEHNSLQFPRFGCKLGRDK